MTAVILRGDARNLPLPDASVDLIVTSPPYYGLRDYQDGGGSLAGQIGAEPTPAEFVDTLLDCTREWMRVLKPEGSMWVNLGDSYYSGKGAPGRTTVDAKSVARTARRAGGNPLDGPSFGVGKKSLVGLPWRYALGCIDQLGLILRAEVIWSKVNSLPESVTDRVRRSHEQFFHFTKQPRYFSAVDEIREPVSGYSRRPGSVRATPPGQRRRAMADTCNPLGALPGSVWEVATQPLRVPADLQVDHYAAFPMEWPRRIILGWSPKGVCTRCGEGRRPVSVRTVVGADPARRIPGVGRDPYSRHGQAEAGSTLRGRHSSTITGYACACPQPDAPIRPGVVVDPFGGTGTTALAASVLGRTGVTIDRSADYCRIAQWRTQDPRERARALGVKPPDPVAPDQASLFEDIA